MRRSGLFSSSHSGNVRETRWDLPSCGGMVQMRRGDLPRADLHQVLVEELQRGGFGRSAGRGRWRGHPGWGNSAGPQFAAGASAVAGALSSGGQSRHEELDFGVDSVDIAHLVLHRGVEAKEPGAGVSWIFRRRSMAARAGPSSSRGVSWRYTTRPLETVTCAPVRDLERQLEHAVQPLQLHNPELIRGLLHRGLEGTLNGPVSMALVGVSQGSWRFSA